MNGNNNNDTTGHPFLVRPNDIPDDIICSICHNVPLQPIVLRQCEHIFCLHCIQQSFHHIGRICPIDRRECCDNTADSATGSDSSSTINTNVDSSIQPLKENTFVYRIWCSIQVQCYHKTIGCNWIGSIYDYQKSHQYKCQYDPITIQKQIHKKQKVEQSLIISQQLLYNTQDENNNDQSIIIDEIDTSENNNNNNEASCTSCTSCTRNKARLQLKQIDNERLVEENIILQNEIDELINQVRSLKNKQQEQKQKDKETLRPKHGAFDTTYSYNRNNIQTLNTLIATYLENKPSIIDTNRIYNCIKNCYTDYTKEYGDNPPNYYLDVRMLLATSVSSNWFTSKQFSNLKQWYKEI